MRIVFDTNVVVSGLLWSGAPHQALRFAAGKRIAAITSEALVDELRDVLNRQKLRRFLERIQKSADELVEDYLAYTAIIEPFPVLDDAVSDIDDLIVLEAAVGGGANCVVTGDDDLLRIGSYAEIAILPVQALVQRIEDDDLSQALGE
ncbi:MAG: putative toxin-antitoxin system toxin component, PIN family [Chloroflexi bacterium]|nr:putative toxin-antitoxin system toxin component, PIN family [Chloroflexota bacterium]MCO6443656.1 putative toxin-antitoxin system toxin component, PIN family [Anaerolineae bacterium]NOG48110.1 putative toxin-antitoxin system toxin component, PIN family [Chloroflexota bacterium]GIK28712.1 MAG: PIN domain-containing protein [Chloroflexota bacterium]